METLGWAVVHPNPGAPCSSPGITIPRFRIDASVITQLRISNLIGRSLSLSSEELTLPVTQYDPELWARDYVPVIRSCPNLPDPNRTF
uniref:Uncharacterized protein n=1 Tax=Anguilla anguilla TaxID=7936 RepID=A0A0E9X7N7_ANGAN